MRLPPFGPTDAYCSGLMLTTTELLRARADGIVSDIDVLLDHSAIQHFNPDLGGAFYFGATGEWRDLDTEGRRLQSKILGDYGRYHALVTVLLRGQPADSAHDLDEADETVRAAVDQSHNTWAKTIEEARRDVHKAIESMMVLVERLHDAGGGEVAYVPDTNGLLQHVDLDRWTFSDSPTFELVLTPTVLVELDELKVNHRNQDIRDKAEGLIRRIKGYRGRGSLTDGVTLRAGASTIRAIGEEPRMGDSLPWLDPDNRDDRFIASVIEVMRSRPRSPVVIVARDINLQNKAELASLPFVEPPDP